MSLDMQKTLTFDEHLAAFRKAHPGIEAAEVYVTDLNGVARGKLMVAAKEGRAIPLGDTMPLDTQFATTGAARRHLERDGAPGSWHIDDL